jgi:hypothetical protein
MKLSKPTLIVNLCLLIAVLCGTSWSAALKQQNNQKQDPELKKLEDLLVYLNELDKAGSPAKIVVEADKKEKGKLIITLLMPSSDKSSTKKNVLKTQVINLNNIKVSDKSFTEKYVTKSQPLTTRPQQECGELPNVEFEHIGVTQNFRILKEYIYKTTKFDPNKKYTIIVPQFYEYDRASIPRALLPIITKEELGSVAPLIHDRLYRNKGILPVEQVIPYRTFSRKEADSIFYEAMIRCGVGRLKAELAWGAVRVAFWAWKDIDEI